MARVLIVDDSPTETHILRSIVEKMGHSVATASSGEDGVSAAKALSPDLILMDVVMPGLNGFQATRELSKTPETSRIPVVVVSTKDQQTDRVWALRQGAREYLVKPVQPKTLEQVIRQLLDE
ncbi:MAG: PleD family two-component system response regulator [Thioalkalivibrionaceae bacterium]